MLKHAELQLAKDFVEISLLLNFDNKFLFPKHFKSEEYQKLLYKVVFDMEKKGSVGIMMNENGQLVASRL